MNWRAKQKEELADHLYETSISLFQELGYDTTSVNKICDAAGVAKGTFFNHFPTKEAVLVRYITLITADALSDCRGSYGDCATDNILKICLSLFRHARKDESLFHAVCRISPHHKELRDLELKLDADIVAALTEQVNLGIQNGEFASQTEVDVLVPLLLAALTATAHEWAFSEEEFNPETEISRRATFLLNAIKGEK
ncbi:TetR/AcrR family transcriptional regulator [Alteromonas facilis]|uniref:TetR/AcrR family transcriptional regulator n=1 Tax=Alteromonas facilis TaxID=2048004 RepID=UPI000C284E52|nr:TetR/AcrR family transcriptional regulator [Alteromonas facilis]